MTLLSCDQDGHSRSQQPLWGSRETRGGATGLNLDTLEAAFDSRRMTVMQKSSVIGGLEHYFFWLSIQLGTSSSQLTFIFFRGIETTNQISGV